MDSFQRLISAAQTIHNSFHRIGEQPCNNVCTLSVWCHWVTKRALCREVDPFDLQDLYEQLYPDDLPLFDQEPGSADTAYMIDGVFQGYYWNPERRRWEPGEGV